MIKFEVSVIICTYNSDWYSLKSTLVSILSQKDIGFEVILADDGSKESHFNKAETFFKHKGFSDYVLYKQAENVGTVKNYYDAICLSRGEYIYGISPGDMLYDEYVLNNLYEFAKEKNIKICFGNVVYYSLANNKVSVIKDKVNAPCKPWYFDNKTTLTRMKEEFVLGNYIIGASFFREAKTAKKYIGEIVEVSKYTEDNTSTAFILADGIRVHHFDSFVVWYEFGTGISTSNINKWNYLIKKDFDYSNDLLLKRFPDDRFIKHIVKISRINSILFKIIYCVFKCPDILLRKIIRKCTKVSVGYSAQYDQNILIEYLKQGDRIDASN